MDSHDSSPADPEPANDAQPSTRWAFEFPIGVVLLLAMVGIVWLEMLI